MTAARADCTVFIVDDDPAMRDRVSSSLRSVGIAVETFANAREFLDHHDASRPGCIVMDARMPSSSGIALREFLFERGIRVPVILIAGYADAPTTVRAITSDSVNILAKPFAEQDLLEAVNQAIQGDALRRGTDMKLSNLKDRLSQLTTSEREVMERVLDGKSVAVIAAELGLSLKVVEVHRTRMMAKLRRMGRLGKIGKTGTTGTTPTTGETGTFAPSRKPTETAPSAVDPRHASTNAIEGVATSTAGFVGRCHRGPTEGPPRLVTSFGEFESVFGGLDPFTDQGPPGLNHLAHAARAFFENGGGRLYVTRVGDGTDLVAGSYDWESANKRALASFENVDEISIVAAPGSTAGLPVGSGRTIAMQLISHCERMRDRIALLDTPPDQTVTDVRAYRAGLDSSYAALYYPWVVVADPSGAGTIHLPPSGFVAGVYAQNDAARGVHNAPVNEIVRLAIGLEQQINYAQQDLLNPDGINCLRYLDGLGYRVWGARTTSADAKWRYVNVRRYFSYLEQSLVNGTHWVVFEPNDEALWAELRAAVEAFLCAEWRSGRLQGTKQQDAFFVCCDRRTTTQNDIDEGRLICEVGVAAMRTAEFMTLQIRQNTAAS